MRLACTSPTTSSTCQANIDQRYARAGILAGAGFSTILQRASAPLKKADLLAVAHYLIGHLSYSQVPVLAKRHKVEAKKDSASAQELLAKQVGTYDEAELCKLLLEISLLDSAYQRSTTSREDVLMDAAKRYRVDAEKLQKTVAKEFAAKRDKKSLKAKGRKTAA